MGRGGEAGTDAPAEVLSATPCPADPNVECTARFVRVDWFADDGGLDRCECVPPGEVQCTTHDQHLPDAAPPETPLGPSLCQCNVCGAARVQTFRCGYDTYNGNWTVVDCVE